MKVTKELIGERIGQLRTDRRMTQQQLAEKSGVGLGTIKNTESNQQGRTLSKIDDLLRIADALGVTPLFLLTTVSDENYVVSDELGLSEDSVNLLKKKNAEGKTEIAEMINLFCDSRFAPHKLLPVSGELLLSAMYAYIHCEGLNVYDKTSESGNGQYIGNHEEFYLVRIMNELKCLREYYQKTRAQKTDSDDCGRDAIFLNNGHIF